MPSFDGDKVIGGSTVPTVSVNDVDLYYEEAGDGFPVVLCHGYTGSHYDWALQIPMLARQYRVVAMDHRGHGLSEAPLSSSDYSIPTFSRDVGALLEHLGIEKCYLVGHSMGGFIALQFVVDYPQLVDALILVGTGPAVGDASEQNEVARKLHQIARTDGLDAAFEYEVLHNPFTRQYLDKYPDRREIAKQTLLNTSVEGYVCAWEAIMEWQGVVERIGEIIAPTLILVGEEDSAFLGSSKVMAETILSAQLRVIPGVGHSPQEEAPYTFNRELIGFLAGLA